MTQNPKAIEGDKKTPLHLLPPVALEQIAWAHKAGADAYGKFNWRTQPIQMTTYVAAVMRHTLAWAGGEDIDPKSGLSHLAHIGANANILLDAAHCGALVDDRPRMPSKDITLRCRNCGEHFTCKPSDPLANSDLCVPCKVKRVGGTTGYPRSGSKQPLSDEPGWVPPTPLPPGFSEDFAVPTGMNGIQPSQYRMLEAGEIIQVGDEVTAFTGPSRWIPAYGPFLERPVYSHNVGCIRRPIYSGAEL